MAASMRLWQRFAGNSIFKDELESIALHLGQKSLSTKGHRLDFV